MPTETIVIPGNGTGTLAVQLHGPDITAVEAVLAEIDTSGAGDTVATLTATSPTGNDVAAVPQGSPVSGGGQGRATWALRLAEDGAGAAGGPPEQTFSDSPVFHTTVAPNVETDLPWLNASGPFLLNAAIHPFAPTVVKAGVYAFSIEAEHAVAAMTTGTWALRLETVDSLPRQASGMGTFRGTSFLLSQAGTALVRRCDAGCVCRVKVEHAEAAAVNFSFNAAVVRLG